MKNPQSSESVNQSFFSSLKRKKKCDEGKSDGRKEGPREQESILIKLPKKKKNTPKIRFSKNKDEERGVRVSSIVTAYSNHPVS